MQTRTNWTWAGAALLSLGLATACAHSKDQTQAQSNGNYDSVAQQSDGSQTPSTIDTATPPPAAGSPMAESHGVDNTGESTMKLPPGAPPPVAPVDNRTNAISPSAPASESVAMNASPSEGDSSSSVAMNGQSSGTMGGSSSTTSDTTGSSGSMASNNSSTAAAIDASTALQRLDVFNRAELPIAKFIAKKGNAASAKYGTQLHKDRLAAAGMVERTGASLGVKAWPLNDATAMKELTSDRAALASMKKLQGAELDRAFARHMRDDRQEAIDMARSVRANCSDPQVRALVDKLLPGIQDELDRANNDLAGAATSATND